ncbi:MULTISPECIES: c-type cytochrome [unclassified Roseobacter]|uniref:c-type cytochrome n=1 Tax=unclassified Roseobacter TaxID=196798 RepID=UPI0018A2C6DB|nr:MULTISPECIES: cytochrome c [unclassified Roseobacter]MDW3184295.1 cytochrome c [Roseobacter sp.]
MRFLIVAALCLGQQVHAQDAQEGQSLFRLHCAACHGIEGRGNGPMSPVLLVQPADLTTLSKKEDGTFPTYRVVKRIDGRDPLVSHGSDMPVYGWFFEGNDVAISAQSGQPIMTSQPVADLVAWLRTIQE